MGKRDSKNGEWCLRSRRVKGRKSGPRYQYEAAGGGIEKDQLEGKQNPKADHKGSILGGGKTLDQGEKRQSEGI